jgi:predicted metal-dependent phosphoesterase TrpH
MMYRYETHCHSSQCSRCGRSTSQELVRAYFEAGYTGLVLTDHFIHGNTAVDRNLPWKEQMQCYYDAYLDACKAAEGLDFDVIFGIEHAYGDGKEVLIYGIDLPFLLSNPDIPELTLDELVARVHAYGGIVVQAHPYRDRSYVNMSVEPRADIVDGIEVYNVYNKPGEDKKALALSAQKDYILTCGGDIHTAADPNIGAAGILLPRRVHDEKEFVAALKQRSHGFIVQGNVVDRIQEADLP